MPFKVIEFNKDAKRIILSHTRTFEEGDKAEATEKKATKKAAKKEEAPALEKTTLGDIEGLAALKDALTESENKTAAKKTTKKAAKKDEE